MDFKTVHDFRNALGALPANQKVIFLFDEFQQMLNSSVLDELLGVLKTLRDNRAQYRIMACLCFGTYQIIHMSTQPQRSLSPFHIETVIQLKAPSLDLLRTTLSAFSSSLVNPLNRSILEDVVSLSAGHLGIFSMFGKYLYNHMASKGLHKYDDWLNIKSRIDLYAEVKFQKPYSLVNKEAMA